MRPSCYLQVWPGRARVVISAGAPWGIHGGEAVEMSRFIAPAPRAELERRWALVRERLRDRGIDALVIAAQSNQLDGAVRWLTDGSFGYRRMIVFHVADLMTVYEQGSEGNVRDLDGDRPDYPGVGRLVGVPSFPSVDYTSTYEAKAIGEELRKRGYRRIALHKPNAMPYGFHSTLREALTGVEFIDETDFVDRAKAIKSPVEIEVLERAAAIQDTIFERTVAHAKPGMREREIAAFVEYQAKLLDGGDGIVLVGSAPHGEPAYYRAAEQQGRVIGKGDTFSVLVESASPGGYFVEVSRMVSVGPPSTELVDVFEHSRQAQDYALTLLKPGAKSADIYEVYSKFLHELGYPPEGRVFSHGQGYDLVERPLIRWDENMALEAGMCLAVHPALTANGAFSVLCDNVIIEADGPRLIHKTPRQLFQI